MASETPEEPEGSTPKPETLGLGNLDVSTIFVTQSAAPPHVGRGLWNGTKSLSLIALGGLATLIILPVKIGSDWYKKAGVVGAIGGGLVGTVAGAVSCAGLLVAGTVSFLYQSVNGLLRTPGAIYHSVQGKEWDHDAEEWSFYDLPAESAKLSRMTEEEFIHKLDNQSVSSVYSSYPLPGEQSVSTEGGGEVRTRPKKDVVDRELYDILGIEPEATAGEIKKAYYVKARLHHPDRNPGPEANAMFQKIGQAYQVLGDDTLRSEYDTKGKSALEKSGTVDASMLYMMLFGSEQFEAIIGELQVSMIIRHMADTHTKPSAIMRFRQRKRELQCALALVAKLDHFVNGDVEVFREKAGKDVVELTETLMGTLLLHYIGMIYQERARIHIASIDNFANEFMKPFRAIGTSFTYCTSGVNTAYGAWELHSIHQEAERRQKIEDDRNNIPEADRHRRKAQQALGLSGFYGPNPTSERKQEVKKKIKKFSNNLLKLIWHYTKQDIRITLKNVCRKVLHDHSVIDKTRNLRAQGMLLLGEIYASKTVEDTDGLGFLLERLGKQTGLFTDDLDADSPTGEEKKDDDHNGDNHSDDSESDNPIWQKYKDMPDTALKPSQARDKLLLRELKLRVDTLSVKELKYHIELLGADWEVFVEKRELQVGLRERIDLVLAEIDFNEEAR